MAGDLNTTEYAMILGKRTRALEAVPAETIPCVHRYGDRVLIGPTPPPAASRARTMNPAVDEIPASLLNELSMTERMGLEALRQRVRPDYIRSKQHRPKEGQTWNMDRCAHGPQSGASEALRGARAAAPTSSYLEGSVAVGLVMVEGPTPALQFSAQERTKVTAEVQNGLSWLASMNPSAGISFTYDIRVVTLQTQPDPTAPDLEARWRDPAMAALGYEASRNGVLQYAEAIRQQFATQWTYCAFFTKYPLSWFAYAFIGGPYLVMDYNNDGWGPDNIDRVFAHESGHIFGCPDEYASSGCNCGGSWGRFGRPNTNCENCAPNGGVDCLMRANTWALCDPTRAHFGWADVVADMRNPVLIQSRFGKKGNFELTVPVSSTGVSFTWRNNDNPALPWSALSGFGKAMGKVEAISMIQSNFGSPGNLELVARVGQQLQFMWRDSGPAFQWNGPTPIFTGARGNPVLLQSRFGTKGNFELVVPAATGGGLFFLWRNNDNPSLPWSAPVRFGQALGTVDEVTMIQSNFGSPGNLELIARVGQQLQFMWRDSGPAFQWNGPTPIFTGARGNPVLLQSRFGTKGNFELVVPAATGGGLFFLWRNNDNPALPWSAPVRFGQALGTVDEVTMIQSNFGSPGNLELIARVGQELHFMWRDSGPAFQWNGPTLLFTIPAAAPAQPAGMPETRRESEMLVAAGAVHS
ncbi:hypothetical protein [Nitrospira sp. Nam80]